ncbi:hypothetical protein L6164_015561 [Bauhinia variegata]|uniref:Uncharacterized protein n=1 Tax=Bauhinia variegata TaxID=167791 RepID=A0ACB9NKM6_BAUVA|nr:hypothetical protein L6164_015561 [Bauhinia variegata]
MGRAPCCDKANVKRGPWSPEEDVTLKSYVETHGTGGNWIALPKKAGLRRCGKSCRLRWLNYLRPDIKHGGFTEEEDRIICTLYGQMGSRWSAIASQLSGRTDNDVKNYWNTKLKKKLMAGKVSLKTTIDTVTAASTPLLTQIAETQNQSCSPSSLPILSDANSGFNINPQNISFGSVQLFSQGFVDVPEIGANSKNNHMLSLSREGSGISDSSPIAMESKCITLPEHGSDETSEALMDFGFGFHCDFVNGLYYQEKVGELAPGCYPDPLVDFTYADIKPQGLNQNVV